MTWNTTANTIGYGFDNSTDVDGEVTASDVRQVAEEQGLGQFEVVDEDGNQLEPSDMPYDGDVELKEYNENADK